MNSRTHIVDLSFTWDANKNKTSESITGVMSGYGFTAAGTTYVNEDLCFSSSLPPPGSSMLIDIDANGAADVNFQYDALGRRVARSGTGGSVVYVQMDQQTIADYPVGGAATTPTFRYVYASYIDEPVVRKTAGTGGTLVYFHRNHQYSVTAITTSTGAVAERYAYTAYGQPTILDASGAVLQTSNFSIHTSYTGRECLAGACGISGSISMPGNGFTPFRYDFCKEYNCTRWSDPVVCFGKSKRVCFEHEDFCTFYWRHANNGTVPPEPKANEF